MIVNNLHVKRRSKIQETCLCEMRSQKQIIREKYIVKGQTSYGVIDNFLNVATKICCPIHTRCYDTVQVYVILLDRVVVNHMIAS